MKMKTYRVLREHIGDEGKLYSPRGKNNTREANPSEVAHLVGKTLMEIDAEAENKPETGASEKKPAKAKTTKAKVALENKAETGASETKGAEQDAQPNKDA